MGKYITHGNELCRYGVLGMRWSEVKISDISPEDLAVGKKYIHMLSKEVETNDELYHYGVKGMKWGVRKTQKQLGRRNVLKDMEDVIRSLNKSDFKSFEKPKNVYYQKVRYDGEKPIGFVLAESHNEKGAKVVDLSVAVNPNYRGRGIAYDMAKEAMNAAERDRSVSKIYWGAEKSNSASVALATKLGFVHDYDTDYYTIYKKEKNNR